MSLNNNKVQIILLDTSAVSRLKIIKDKYLDLINKSTLTISIATLFELINEKTNYSLRNKLSDFKLMAEPYDIVLRELLSNLPIQTQSKTILKIILENEEEDFLNKNLPLADEKTQKNFLEFLEYKNIFESKKHFFSKNTQSNIETFEKCNPNKNYIINVEDLTKSQEDLLDLIENGNYIKQKSDLNFVRDKFFDYSYDFIKNNGRKSFKEKCLSSFIVLKIQAFYNSIDKFKGSQIYSNSSKKLTINANIKIDKNSFVDLQLSASYLPYIFKFLSTDKSQCNLLTLLLPEYKEKICYIPQKDYTVNTL